MNIELFVDIPARPARKYPILIAAQLLKNWSSWIESYTQSRKIVIISDSTVANLYAGPFCQQLSAAGYSAALLTFPAGEAAKLATTKQAMEEQMFAFGCDRHTLCIALGGGVVGDLAGFTAATYMRGISYIQVPTSLLAMIDSSVGGKTGVNASYGKNVIGAFWQPRAVIMDISLLTTLPQKEIINGLFEAIKIFLVLDGVYVSYCQTHMAAILQLEAEALTQVIKRAVELKALIVKADEHEKNLRMILNYGHTIGHALEKLSNYTLKHGYAVALGMLVEAKISQLMGLLSIDDYQIVVQLLNMLGVTPGMLSGYTAPALIQAMRGDKKSYDQTIVMVLLTGLGQVKNIANKVVFPVTEESIENALGQMLS